MEDMFDPKDNLYCSCEHCIQNCIFAVKKSKTIKEMKADSARAENCRNYEEAKCQ